MRITQADFALIANPKIRRRTLQLPVRYGSFGEMKKCPLREGGVYNLSARAPYERYVEQAARAPTRARAVLALIDQCEVPQKTVTVTVTLVERVGESWTVRFKKGEHREDFDRNIYLCRDNDFTMAASRQTVRGDAPYLPPLAEDLKRAREKALEKRSEPNRSNMALMHAAHRRLAVRRHTMSVDAARQLDRVGKAMVRLESLLSPADGVSLSGSDCAQDLEARELDADTESSTESVVSSQAA